MHEVLGQYPQTLNVETCTSQRIQGAQIEANSARYYVKLRASWTGSILRNAHHLK